MPSFLKINDWGIILVLELLEPTFWNNLLSLEPRIYRPPINTSKGHGYMKGFIAKNSYENCY